MSLLRALNDDKKNNLYLHKKYFFFIFFTLTRLKAVKGRHHIFYYIYYSPLFIISEPILSICLSNASSAFFPILENLPLSQFHILLHPLTFTRGCS